MQSFGVVVAGGQGSRLGFPKQYVNLAGKSMWERSAESLLAGGVSAVWLVVPEGDVSEVTRYIAQRPDRPVPSVVAGGASRAESVERGIKAIFAKHSGASEEVLVAIHDAARPFVAAVDVAAVLAAAEQWGAAMLGVACVDTMKKVTDGQVVKTVAREGLWHAQTPQVFRSEWLREVYQRMSSKDFDRVSIAGQITDDASLMEIFGYPVRVVPSSSYNGKVTTAADLEYATWLAIQRWGGR